MPANRNIIDLSVGFSFPDTTRSFIKKFFSIDVLGIYDNRLLDNEKDSLVLRIQNTKQGLITTKNNYFYLYYQDFQGNLDNTYGNTDILTIYDFFNSKNLLKKLAGKNIGFEFMVSKLRYLNVSDLGKWFSFVKYFSVPDIDTIINSNSIRLRDISMLVKDSNRHFNMTIELGISLISIIRMLALL